VNHSHMKQSQELSQTSDSTWLPSNSYFECSGGYSGLYGDKTAKNKLCCSLHSEDVNTKL